MRTDALVKVHLVEAGEGGRWSPIIAGIYHGIMMFDSERGYDFRSEFFSSMKLGETRDIAVAFLCPEDVAPLLYAGKVFTLSEGHPIGEGNIIESYI